VLLRKLINVQNLIVADIGTGEGRWAIFFAQQGAEYVYALDISEEMLEIAKRKAKEKGVYEKIVFKQGNILNLELSHNFFDIVYCMETLIHLKDPQRAINNMAKALKKGGIIFANMEKHFIPRFYLYRAFYYYLYWTNSYKSILSPLYYNKAFAPLRYLLGHLFKLPLKAPYEYGLSNKFSSFNQLGTAEDTIKFLKQYPEVEVNFPVDAIDPLSKEKFISLFINAGLTILKIIPEGYWFFPKGDIVIARK